MYAYIGLVMCFFVGSSVAYYPQREVQYQGGPNELYAEILNSNFNQEPSQRLFWGNQGSNQVGGTGFWAHLTNKFPFLGNMFGRMELPTQYGAPNQYDVPSTQYNVPSTQYGAPGFNQVPHYPQQQQQFYQPGQQYYQQLPQQFTRQFVPSARDVGITDDAIIVTPPFVPPVQPAPAPVPVPVPAPAPAPAPVPTPGGDQGYSYNKPQYRLELPHK
ncbi:uncharacterized protein LOC142974350 [Anticarsia gemmatalis]|uniref:uncharacterized protein LOC142974350 n=1 Tax=Anticarsia gemmatalis TaxID=129554 RepID=UPI003F763470